MDGGTHARCYLASRLLTTVNAEAFLSALLSKTKVTRGGGAHASCYLASLFEYWALVR